MSRYNGLRGDQNDPEKVAAFRARSEAIEKGKSPMADEPTTPPVLNRGRPPHDSSAERKAEIIRLNAEGLSGVQIARQLGVTPAAVSYHLKQVRLAEATGEVTTDGGNEDHQPAGG